MRLGEKKRLGFPTAPPCTDVHHPAPACACGERATVPGTYGAAASCEGCAKAEGERWADLARRIG